ncbi:MAG TPA: DUF952 domain-containing protein [Kofleriaceae bacterium]|jgi:uncharacterized protein (DUF952 family)
MIFHVVPADEWERARAAGVYAPDSLRELGFIHLCEQHQVAGVLARFFAGRSDLVVLAVREDRLRAALRREPVDGDMFPHLFGPLELDAVVGVTHSTAP